MYNMYTHTHIHNPSLKFTVRGRLLESRIPPSTLIRVPMALHAHACSKSVCCLLPTVSIQRPNAPRAQIRRPEIRRGERHFTRVLYANPPPSSLDAFRSALPDLLSRHGRPLAARLRSCFFPQDFKFSRLEHLL